MSKLTILPEEEFPDYSELKKILIGEKGMNPDEFNIFVNESGNFFLYKDNKFYLVVNQDDNIHVISMDSVSNIVGNCNSVSDITQEKDSVKNGYKVNAYYKCKMGIETVPFFGKIIIFYEKSMLVIKHDGFQEINYNNFELYNEYPMSLSLYDSEITREDDAFVIRTIYCDLEDTTQEYYEYTGECQKIYYHEINHCLENNISQINSYEFEEDEEEEFEEDEEVDYDIIAGA